MTGPFSALNLALAQVFKFSGRATRSEFWWVFGAYVLVVIAATVYDIITLLVQLETYGANVVIAMLSPGSFVSVWVGVILAIPLIGLTVRRLHDAGFSGLWAFAGLLPAIGALALLLLCGLPSQNAADTRRPAMMGSATTRTKRQQKSNDPYAEAMKGYAVLFDKDRAVTPEVQAARKAEVLEYYRTKVLKPAPGV